MISTYTKLLFAFIAAVGGVVSAYAFEVYPWPGYKSEARTYAVEKRVYMIERRMKRDELTDHHWDMIEIERDLKEREIRIEDAPETLRKLYFDKKHRIQELEQELKHRG